MDTPDWLEEELQELRTARDELRVQLDLARKDARDRFEAAEKHWHELEAKLRSVGQESKDALEDVAAATRLLRDEIREAYRHIRASI